MSLYTRAVRCIHYASTLRRLAKALFLFLALGLAACANMGCQTDGQNQSSWRAVFDRELPVLGHRNWIVVADSAYPAQASPGVETLYTGGKQLDVLQNVLAALDQTRHVQPIMYLDSELEQVPESLAPGVGAYRSELRRLLEKRRVVALPHEQLIAKLDEAGKTFRLLILKTDLTIPYTSVFMQLDCGYWGPESEKQLRDAIARHRSE